MSLFILQTVSVRACARALTLAGAAIFVRMGAEKFSEMCMHAPLLGAGAGAKNGVRAPHITIFGVRVRAKIAAH